MVATAPGAQFRTISPETPNVKLLKNSVNQTLDPKEAVLTENGKTDRSGTSQTYHFLFKHNTNLFPSKTQSSLLMSSQKLLAVMANQSTRKPSVIFTIALSSTISEQSSTH
ncbi:hypothetical protein WAI453_002532 [Rhynchosporium graminicola]